MTLMLDPSTTPSRKVSELRAELTELQDVLWAAQRPTELVATVTEIEWLKSQLDAIELEVVAEMEATQAAQSAEWGSTADFLTAVCGGSGRAIVRLAQALTTAYAATLGALADGRISRTQAQAIVAAVDRLPIDPAVRKAGEEHLLGQAEHFDAAELRLLGKRLAEVVDPDGDERATERQLAREERAAHLGRYLSIRDDHAGGVYLKGRASVEDAAVIRTTLFPLAAPRPDESGVDPTTSARETDCPTGRDPRDHGTRLLDALVEACQRLQDLEVLPEAHGAKPRISITIDHEALRDLLAPGLLDTGQELSAHTIRRLGCDADLLPAVLGSTGELLDVGHTQRLVTPAIWRALGIRDAHCAFPGCRRAPIACDAHHVVSWLDGGETSLTTSC